MSFNKNFVVAKKATKKTSISAEMETLQNNLKSINAAVVKAVLGQVELPPVRIEEVGAVEISTAHFGAVTCPRVKVTVEGVLAPYQLKTGDPQKGSLAMGRKSAQLVKSSQLEGDGFALSWEKALISDGGNAVFAKGLGFKVVGYKPTAEKPTSSDVLEMLASLPADELKKVLAQLKK